MNIDIRELSVAYTNIPALYTDTPEMSFYQNQSVVVNVWYDSVCDFTLYDSDMFIVPHVLLPGEYINQVKIKVGDWVM